MDPHVCPLCSTVVYFGDKHSCFSNMNDETNNAVPHQSEPASWGSGESAENYNDSYGDIGQASHHSSYNWQASTSSSHSVFYPINNEVSEGAFETSRYFTNRPVPTVTTFHAPSSVSNMNQTLDSKQDANGEAGPSGIRQHPYGPGENIQFPGHLYGIQIEQRSSILPHFMRHTGEAPQVSGICGKGLAQVVNLDAHARTTAGQKLFACKFCLKEFTGKSDLNRHLRTHTGEKPFKCNYCGKKFSLKCNLKTHMTTHTGERPYVCNYCGKNFTQKAHLTTHMRTHTGEKPYKCDICGRSFSDRRNWKNHVARH